MTLIFKYAQIFKTPDLKYMIRLEPDLNLEGSFVAFFFITTNWMLLMHTLRLENLYSV